MDAIGFIGLGAMGEPMAANVLKAGYALTVYNRTPTKSAALVAQGAQAAHSVDLVATPGAIVVTMVANDRALEEVTLGSGGFGERLGRGGVHLCMATVSPDLSRHLAGWHAQRGSLYVAAPVFGRPPAAAAGKLWIMCSGPAAAKQRVAPLLNALGQGVFDFGEDPGAANIVKISGNFLMSCVIESLAEAFTVGEKNGIAREAMSDMFTQTIFACPLYQSYSPLVAAGPGDKVAFSMHLGLKDVNLMLDTAEKAGVPIPFGSVVHDRIVSAISRGRGDKDWIAMSLNVSEDAGLKVER
jgi:3-hydroxyisobutyrate dehydrogenase-like beta-hydroxyacid dehydrogenase